MSERQRSWQQIYSFPVNSQGSKNCFLPNLRRRVRSFRIFVVKSENSTNTQGRDSCYVNFQYAADEQRGPNNSRRSHFKYNILVLPSVNVTRTFVSLFQGTLPRIVLFHYFSLSNPMILTNPITRNHIHFQTKTLQEKSNRKMLRKLCALGCATAS